MNNFNENEEIGVILLRETKVQLTNLSVGNQYVNFFNATPLDKTFVDIKLKEIKFNFNK